MNANAVSRLKRKVMKASPGKGLEIERGATHKNLLACAFILFCLTVATHEMRAGVNRWTSNGPFGGMVSTLAVDPMTPTTIYAGTVAGGVFKSTDSGSSWTVSGLMDTRIRALAIDPSAPTTIYSGTDSGIFKSNDGGVSWVAINSGLTNTNIHALAIDPTAHSTIYAGTWGEGVFKSTDGGATWVAKNGGMATANISALAINPLTPSILLAGTWGIVGIFMSTDGGTSWVAKNAGLTRRYIYTLVFNPLNPSVMYAGTNGGYFTSTCGGCHWSGPNLSSVQGIPALAIDPLDPNIMYAGTMGGGIFKQSFPYGPWVAMNNGLTDTNVVALAINRLSTAVIYAGTAAGGVFKSTNSGSNWAAVNSGLIGTNIRSLAIDPQLPSTIYAGTYGSGLFKSTDSGSSWVVINNGLTDPDVQTIAIDPLTPSTIYAGTNGSGVFKSTDSGSSWSSICSGLTDFNIFAIAIDPLTPATIYAGTYNDGVFKSTDSGFSWTAINNGLTGGSVYDLAIDKMSTATIYAGTNGSGVFKSTDSGSSWAAINNGITDNDILVFVIDPLNTSIVYAGSLGGGVFKSTDGGASWAPFSNGITYPDIIGLAIDPLSTDVIYAGSRGGGVFKSKNGGSSWEPINYGLTNIFVFPLAIDPITPANLYAGTQGGGVFASMQVPPLVTGLSPTSGCAGTEITISGERLSGASAVTFGTTPAASFAVVSDTQIVAVCAAREEGVVNVTVTAFGNDSAASTGNQFVYCNFTSAPSIISISDDAPCSQNGITVTFTPGSGAVSHSLLKDDAVVAAGITSPFSYNPGGTGNYSYKIRALRESCGCGADSSPRTFADADYTPAPTVTGPDSACYSATLTTGTFSGYQWRLDSNPIPGATDQTYDATATGTYSVAVINSSGCSGTSAGKSVTILAPTPEIAGDRLNICPATSVTLSAGSYTSYLWSLNSTAIPGATAAIYESGVSGNYTVTVTNSYGCDGTSQELPVFIDFCPESEISPSGAIYPFRIVKDQSSSTGYYAYFQRIDTTEGFNMYEGSIGSFYSHASSPGNLCDATVTDLGTGEMRAEIAPSPGNHYYLVTAFGGGSEGPSGFDSQAQEIPKSHSTCSP